MLSQISRTLVIVGFACFASACYHTKLSPEAQVVRVTAQQEAVKGCQSKGVIRSSDSQGGLFNKGVAANNVDIKIRNEAAKLKANVVLLVSSNNGYWGSGAVGEAFICPAP